MQTCISVFLMLGKSANFNHGSNYSLLPNHIHLLIRIENKSESGTSRTVRVYGGHLCIYAEAPTEPAGETLSALQTEGIKEFTIFSPLSVALLRRAGAFLIPSCICP